MLSAEEKKIQAQAHYNIGNSFFQQQAFEQAVAAYKQALELDATDEDAKVNLELALEKLQEQHSNSNRRTIQKSRTKSNSKIQSRINRIRRISRRIRSKSNRTKISNSRRIRSRSNRISSSNNRVEQDQQPEEQPAEQQSISPEEAQQLMDALKNRELEAQQRRFRATGKAQARDW